MPDREHALWVKGFSGQAPAALLTVIAPGGCFSRAQLDHRCPPGASQIGKGRPPAKRPAGAWREELRLQGRGPSGPTGAWWEQVGEQRQG